MLMSNVYVCICKVAAGKRPLVNFTHPVDMNSDYLKLMERCWKLEPAERPLMKGQCLLMI